MSQCMMALLHFGVISYLDLSKGIKGDQKGSRQIKEDQDRSRQIKVYQRGSRQIKEDQGRSS